MNLHPDTAQKLREARALIVRGWCQGHLADDEYGCERDAYSECAVAWCTIGACVRVQPKSGCDMLDLGDLLESVAGANGVDGLARWNDAPGRTHVEVLALFDKAIVIAEGGGT